MYVNREMGTCSGISVRSRLETNSDDRLLDQVREAGSRRQLDRRRRRKASQTKHIDDVQRQTLQRRDNSGPNRRRWPRLVAVTRGQHYDKDVRPTTSPSHLTPLDSTATPVDGSTTTRPSTNYSVALDSSRLNSSTHGRQFVSSSGSTTCPSHSIGLSTPTTSTLTTVATVVCHRNSSATRAQFHSHCVSMIHINRLTDYYNGP